MLGHFKAGRQVKPAIYLWRFGKISSNKSIARDYQVVLINIGAIDSLKIVDARFLKNR